MCAWTSPRTWVAGETVTAAIMNTHVRDQFDYLKSSTGNAVTIGGALSVGSTSQIIAASRVPVHPFTYFVGVEYGNVTATSSGTLQSFTSTHFSTGASPRVVMTALSSATTWISANSASGFTANTTAGNATCLWIAMGQDSNT